MSTSTSAKDAPCAPLSERPGCHSPRADKPPEPRAAQACFHESDFSPAVTLPSASVIASAGTPITPASFFAIAILALYAATLTAGAREAEVVDPPEALALPSFEL